MSAIKHSTGLYGLDGILKGILAGDNIVWQVDSIQDYKALAIPYCRWAIDSGRKLIYFRFASHEPILPPDFGAQIVELNPEEGFETFIAQIHAVIEEAGYGSYYVFDCLSELAGDWYSDQMLGNFFMLTCPYLFDLETVTYFALFRNAHSDWALGPITDTTQLLLEVLRHKERLYVRPIKVQHRYSPTMYTLHAWKDNDRFSPVTSSAVISEIRQASQWAGLGVNRRRGFWHRTFDTAQAAFEDPDCKLSEKELRQHFERLMRMILSRCEGIQRLARKYLDLKDLVETGKRQIGTGLVGGKTAGMLLARAILRKSDPRFSEFLEVHDSFFIGSDVFYTFLVQNGIWWVRQQQRHPEHFLQGSEQARRRILTGTFPPSVIVQLEEMLDYFGQSPFIVRSSSLLEDNFGNSFAGKYESVFCTNQGPRERRIEDLLAAIRTIYASTMSEKALRYRAQKGILDQDEQMALLVMRVSGQTHDRNFYPAVAGVGFSFNPYVWSQDIDPEAGVVRLVFGLGTRAVDRADDDYTRVVALNAPDRRPETNFDQVCQYAQRRVDYLDLQSNQLVSGDFSELVKTADHLPVHLFASRDRHQEERMRNAGRVPEPTWILTFERLLDETDYVETLRNMLKILARAYEHPVDIEFTTNFIDDEMYKINLVQCRPLQVQGSDAPNMPEIKVSSEDTIIRAHGAVIGHSRIEKLNNLVYIVPQQYGNLPLRDRHDVADLISKINFQLKQETHGNTMYLGPGRWGTSSPELGIPVSFAQINNASTICEIVAMREDLVPDVSLGTHFLNELVEMDMLYLALFPDEKDNRINEDFFMTSPNSLAELLPGMKKWVDIVKVIRAGDDKGSSCKGISLHADAMKQTVVCFCDR